MQGCSKDSKTETTQTQTTKTETTKQVESSAPVVVEKAKRKISANEYILSDLNSTQHIVTKTSDGFTLKGAEGKVIIFDIYATWCPPCKAAASHLSSIQENYKDSVVVIGITIEDDVSNEKLQEFREAYTANYMLVNSKENRRLVDAIATHLKVGDRFPIPLMALYKDGVLINHYVGAIQEEFIESDIKRALGK